MTTQNITIGQTVYLVFENGKIIESKVTYASCGPTNNIGKDNIEVKVDYLDRNRYACRFDTKTFKGKREYDYNRYEEFNAFFSEPEASIFKSKTVF